MTDKPTELGALEELHEQPIFHLAFPVTDLEATRLFYVDTLGCRVGRSGENWLDLNFFGYQLTVYLVSTEDQIAVDVVDGHDTPVRHFGLIMNWEDWHRAVDHLNYIGVAFFSAPHIRFKGQLGEQAVFFLRDPGGNCLEFKAFKQSSDIFRAS